MQGNVIDRHRNGTTDGAIRAAISMSRGGGHTVIGNIITRPNNAVFEFSAGPVIEDVAIIGNEVSGPTAFAAPVPLLWIGEDLAPPAADDVRDIRIIGNSFRAAAGYNTNLARLHYCDRLLIEGNTFENLGMTAYADIWGLRGSGEGAGTANFSRDWRFVNNTYRITEIGGPFGCGGYRLDPPFTASGIPARFAGDTGEFGATGTMFSTAAAVSDVALEVLDMEDTGLVMAAGTGAFARQRHTPLPVGAFVLDANWGVGATVAIIAPDARDRRGEIEVTPAGAPGANPTITLTFAQGPYPCVPRAIVARNDVAAPSPAFATWATTLTTLVITFNATPIAGNAYRFAYDVEVA